MLFMGRNMATAEKIIIYALEEHDPGSAQDWRTPRDLWRLPPGVPVDQKSQHWSQYFLTALLTADDNANAGKFLTVKMSMMTISNDYNPTDVTLLIDDTPNDENLNN